jgi:hypothetical protein
MSARSLLLNALLIGIAPGADLKPPANPAQAFRRIWCASSAAHRAFGETLDLVRHDRPLGLL